MSTMKLPDSTRSARRAGLRYRTDSEPGFTRKRRGGSFVYLTPGGHVARSRSDLARFKSLAIPPQWRQVWICKDRKAHLQATGLDARGRKQYLYHAEWQRQRNENKFDGLALFGRNLPKIRRRTARDLRRKGMRREKIVACIVWLLDNSMIRVGNEVYARDNHSFGLTTIRNKHVRVRGDTVRFQFKGKSGRSMALELDHPRVARIIRRCQELPGQELFGYVDDAGNHCDVGSHDVNSYLYEATGEHLTAKDFRTWRGTVIAADVLHRASRRHVSRRKALTTATRKRCALLAMQAAADELGNTIAVCRKFYVHSKLLECWESGKLDACFLAVQRQRKRAGLTVSEAALLRLLKEL
jgi:DNA topoisomerase I